MEIYDAFLQETERVVDKTGCFKLGGRVIEAGAKLAGEKILVRYDPYEPKTMEIWHQGKKITEEGTVLKNEAEEASQSDSKTSYLIGLAKRQTEKRKERFGAIAFRELDGDSHV
jgi:hypothetical protein